MMSKDTSSETMIHAIDARIDGFFERGRSDPLTFFNNVVQKSIMIAERHRTEIGRQINEKRMEAIIKMAKMSDRNFSEIVDFALDKSIELTNSEIGYVGLYDKDRRVIRMMAWSREVMFRCAMQRNPVEFPLDTTGAWGEPIRLGRSVIINDYDNDRRMIKKGTPEGHVELKRLLMVPIFLNGNIIGTAGVANKALEYTWMDEVQLNMLMEEMFSIYGQLEATRARTAENRMIRKLMELSSTGFMFINMNMEIIMMNRLASELMGVDADGKEKVNLESIQNGIAIDLTEAINAIRRDGGTHRMRVTSDGSVYDMMVSGTVGEEFSSSGFSVVFENVTEIHQKDTRIDRAVDHIRTLEGPVLKTMTESFRTLEEMYPESDIPSTLLFARRRMDEALSFMMDYRSVGLNDPEWMLLKDAIAEASEEVDLAGVELNVRVGMMRVLADPAFHLVFKNLISNSMDHGGCVSRVDISCRIENGALTIVYRDDGYGISENMRHFLFDQVDNGKFGIFLINNIISASGFGFENKENDGGAVFEITVPPSHYSLG
ncbi:MAG: GAF domain-containing protein, partial [Candidatus Methanomethylophilaceae archaeon]